MNIKQLLCIVLLLSCKIVLAQNVGVGTSSPTEKLHVDSGAIKIGVGVWDSTKSHLLKFGDLNYVSIGENKSDDRMELKAKSFNFLPSGLYNGNVGIGTVLEPSAKLEVVGQVKITGGAPGLNKIFTSDATGLGYWLANMWQTSGTNISNTNTGNVGIGVFTPSQKLDVAGAIKLGNTTTNTTGSIRLNTTDSSLEAYEQNSWKNVVNSFSVKGGLTSCGICNGTAPYFTSNIRNSYVELTHLRDTIKKSGNYLVILSTYGRGTEEANNIYDLTDNRIDISGEVRVCPNGSVGNTALINKQFFYTTYGNTSGVYTAINYHYEDSEKSTLVYLTEGDIIKTYAEVAQTVGTTAPAQVNGWWIEAQLKFVLIN